jgi:protein TonB
MSAVLHGPFEHGRVDSRALQYAIAGSLLFHAGLLFVVSLERDAGRAPSAPGPIVARIIAPPPAVQAPQPPKPEPKPEPPKPRVPEPPPKPPVVKPAPVVKPSAIPLPVPKAAPEPAPLPPQPAAPASPPQAAAAPPPVASSAPAPAVLAASPRPQPNEGLDPDAVKKYSIDVAGWAKRFKRYPRVAIDNNWEGVVVVRVVVQPNGLNATYTVVKSSGHKVLDDQAVETVSRARPRAPIPPELRGREFDFEMPVFYELKDQGSGCNATTWSTSSRMPMRSPRAWLWWLGTSARTFRPLSRRNV